MRSILQAILRLLHLSAPKQILAGKARGMAINFDWVWSQEPNGRSRVRQVYCHDKPIGRVRRWPGKRSSEAPSEWFTAELMKGAQYEPIEGTYATFKAALERIVMRVSVPR